MVEFDLSWGVLPTCHDSGPGITSPSTPPKKNMDDLFGNHFFFRLFSVGRNAKISYKGMFFFSVLVLSLI